MISEDDNAMGETLNGESGASKMPLITEILEPHTIETQNYKCHSCQMCLENDLDIRFCYYTVSYYCNRCHKNDIIEIPSHILTNWDFTPREVSVNSFKLIANNFTKPLFNINSINRQLLSISKELKQIHVLRQVIGYAREYIITCRFGKKPMLKVCNDVLPNRSHLALDSLYSIQDFVHVNQQSLHEPLIALFKIWSHHILNCDRCKFIGHRCSICNDDEIIHPFHTKYTIFCNTCKSLYHISCFNKNKCPKCVG